MKSLFFFTFKGNRLIYLSPGPEGEKAAETARPVVAKEAVTVTKDQVEAKQADHSTKHAQTEAQILQYNSHPNSKIKAIAADYHGQFQKLDDPKALLERCKGYGKDLPKKVKAYDQAMTELTGLFSGFEAETSLAIAGEKPLQEEGQKQEVTKTVGRKQETAPVKTEATAEERARQAKIDDILTLMGQETFEAILDSDEINEVGIIKLNELTEAQVDKLFSFAERSGDKEDNLEKIKDEISDDGETNDKEISVKQLSTESIKTLIAQFKADIFEKLLTTPQSIQRTIEACGEDKDLMTKLIKQLPEKIDGKDPIKSLDTNALVILINSDKLETFINRMDAEQKANLLGSKLDVKQKEILFLNIFIKEAKGDLIKLSPPTILEKMIDYAFAKEGKNNIEIKLLTGPALTAEVIGTLTQKAAKILLKKENQDKIDQKDRPKIVETIQAKLSTETKIGLIKELTVNEQDGLRLKLIKSILLDKGISPEDKATILIDIIAAQGTEEANKLLSIGKIELKGEQGRLYIKVEGKYWIKIDTFELTKPAPEAEKAVPAAQEATAGTGRQTASEEDKTKTDQPRPAEGEETSGRKALEGVAEEVKTPAPQLTTIQESYDKLALDTPTPSALEKNFKAVIKSNDFGNFLISAEKTLVKLKGFQEILGKLKFEPAESKEATQLKTLSEKIAANIKKIEGFKAEITKQIEKIKPETLLKPIEGKITSYDKGFIAYQKVFDEHLKATPPRITEAKASATGKQSELKAIEDQLSAIEKVLPTGEVGSKYKTALEALRTKTLKPKKDTIESNIKKVEAIKTLQESSQKFETDYKPGDKWTAKTKQLTDLQSTLESLKEPKDAQTKYENLEKLITQSKALKTELQNIKDPLTKIDKSPLLTTEQQTQLTALIKEIDVKIKEVDDKFLKPAEEKIKALETESIRLLTESEGKFTERESKAKSEISSTKIKALASSGNYKDLETLCTAYEADLKGILETITPFETIYKGDKLAKFKEIKGKIEAEQSRIASFKTFSTEANKEKSSITLNKFEFTGVELTINDETKQILTKLGVSLKERELTATSKFLDYDTAKVIEKITLGKEPFGKIKSVAIKVTDVNSKIWEITTTNELGSTETIKMKELVIVEKKTEISAKAKQAAKEKISAKVTEASEKFKTITKDTPADPEKTVAITAMKEAIPEGTTVQADGITFKRDNEKLMAQVPGLDFQEVTTANIHHFALLMKRK